MDKQQKPPVENLQRSLELYRKLLSMIQNPGSEAEVAKFVVEMLFDEYPDFRVCYAVLRPNNEFHVFASRQPKEMRSISGLTSSLPDSPFLQNLHNLHINVIDDIRDHPLTKSLANQMITMFGSVARLDFPFEKKENGEVGMITLSHREPQRWSPFIIQLFTELAELVHLMIREARTRERLYQSETLFKQFTSQMPVVFWVVEPEGSVQNQRIIYVSKAYEEVWGLSIESLMADPLSFLKAIHPDDRERIAKAVAGRRAGPYEQFYRVVRPDGSVRWIRDRGNPILNSAGEIVRNLGIAEDVTALHDAQEKLEATRAQVVSNAKFAALGEMAGGIAHEINNPLAVIHALAQQSQEMHARGQLTPEMTMDHLRTIEKMSNSIATIVKGLRTFSRQTDRDPMLPADLRVILKETLILCEAKIQKANARLELDVPERSLQLRCRASEISQVILNLVSNALDAVENSREKIVSLRLEVNGRMIQLSVEDSGAGVKKELQERIFIPFFTTKDVGKGTGLGLSISKGIVEAHGGHLFLDSSSARTRFVMQLPMET